MTSGNQAAHQQSQRHLRFVWACDQQGRLILADTGTDHVLKPWAGQSLLDNAAIHETSGGLATAIKAQQTFNHLSVQWLSPQLRLTALLSGTPMNDRNGDWIGFRGFGLVKEQVKPEASALKTPGTVSLPTTSPLNADFTGKGFAGTGFAGAGLSDREQHAFAEIGRLLAEAVTAHELTGSDKAAGEEEVDGTSPSMPPLAFSVSRDVQDLLDRLPVGVLVSRGDVPIVMNRLLLNSLDYPDADTFHSEAAITRLFPEQHDHTQHSEWLALTTRTGATVSMRVMFQTIEWGQLAASMMVFVPSSLAGPTTNDRHQSEDIVPPHPADAGGSATPSGRDDGVHDRIGELEAILDTATDGVVVIDQRGIIVSLNKSAQALFGYDEEQIQGQPFIDLFAPESLNNVQDYFEGFRDNGVRSLMNDGREVTGQVRQGGQMPLFMTLGRTDDHNSRFCAVLRDLTAWKKVESDLNDSRKQAEIANAQKSDMLARISHELRTPLSAILGFAEVMVEERFGPVGNPRYQDYLRDIHASGHHLLSLVNDLLDIAKIEAGKFDLDFAAVDANATIKTALGMIHPEAERQQVFLRSSLSLGLPKIVADERTLRQVVLNLLSNAVKFTEAGGQVIVTTGLSQEGEVVLRIRDTGVGMDNEDLKTALELFRQTAAGRKAGGTGLGLPLTKALTEANRAQFSITSDRGRGTLIEITFPSNRVLAE